MKRITTIIIVLMFLSNIQSQDYIPFPDSLATWNVNQFYNNDDRGINFHLEGDTLVNDTSYSKMYVRLSYLDVGSPQSFTIDESPYVFLGGVREDETKRVWYRNMNFDEWESNPWPIEYLVIENFTEDETSPLVEQINASTEVLLYNFGLQIGDSILFQADIEVSEPYFGYVEEISIDVWGRNTIKFSYPADCWLEQCGRIWVEGIGEIRSHPFSLYDSNEIIGLGWEYGNNLRCFWENGEQVYVNAEFGGDFLDNCENLNVGIYEIEKQSLEIYPNPSSGLFSITLPNYKSSSLTIFNALGSEVYNQHEIIGDQFTLDLTHFPKGIYMVLLESEKGSYSGKVVKE